ncbi:MAG TPA: efflux RND transporter periplasmic adaptor subunit [Gallionella sp.]|nr:efflux RND transporter periplasmic adaptor subunit [Gallionella sp.]
MALSFLTPNRGRWLVGGVVVFLALAGCGRAPADKAAKEPAVAKPALTVSLTTLQPAQWERTLAANGGVAAWQEAIITAQLPGLRISEVKVGIGDHVKQGDVLVTLGNLTRAGEDYVQGRVIAPDDGVISAANASVGSMVQSGAELFRLIRKGRLEWRAELTAEELILLRKGMPVEVSAGEGRIVKGRVRAISPSVNAQTRYGYALVDLPNDSGMIAGMFARGSFQLEQPKPSWVLPQSAVMLRDSQAYVFMVGADSRVQERRVGIGSRRGEQIEIVAGLEQGESVVESGGAFLVAGDTVSVVPGSSPLPQAGEGANAGSR